VGDAVEVDGHRLTVTEMDARRIARVRVGPAAPGAGDGQGPTVAETAEGPATESQGPQASGGSRGSPPGASTGGFQGGLPPRDSTTGRATPPAQEHAP